MRGLCIDRSWAELRSETFNLLSAQWLPVRRRDDTCVGIAPHRLTVDLEGNRVVGVAWPRPDFQLAALKFLIGLLATAFPPRDRRDWLTF